MLSSSSLPESHPAEGTPFGPSASCSINFTSTEACCPNLVVSSLSKLLTCPRMYPLDCCVRPKFSFSASSTSFRGRYRLELTSISEKPFFLIICKDVHVRRVARRHMHSAKSNSQDRAWSGPTKVVKNAVLLSVHDALDDMMPCHVAVSC